MVLWLWLVCVRLWLVCVWVLNTEGSAPNQDTLLQGGGGTRRKLTFRRKKRVRRSRRENHASVFNLRERKRQTLSHRSGHDTHT